jgi:hypothetical protein
LHPRLLRKDPGPSRLLRWHPVVWNYKGKKVVLVEAENSNFSDKLELKR